MFNDTDRGQVGIGTLIVFIAMVLVAAIAAGVLINTAGLLQSQAEATGQETSDQVTDRVQVQSITGSTDSTPEITELDIVVRKSPGSGDIDLTNAVIEVFANGESGTLTDSEFTLTDVAGTTDGEVLSDNSDRANINIDLDSNPGGDAPLDEGETVTLQITTGSGGTTFVEKRAPESLDDDSQFRL